MTFKNLPFKNLLVSLTLCAALSAGLMSAPAKAQEDPTGNSAENDAQSGAGINMEPSCHLDAEIGRQQYVT